MIPLQSHQILNVEVFFQLNHVDFIAIKKKKFYFLYSHFLNKTMFKDKTYIMNVLAQGLCRNLKQLKMERKMELTRVLRGRKDVLGCLQETQRKTEKDVWLH